MITFLTGILGGLLLAYLSQIITIFLITPYIELTISIAKISSDLLFYLNRIANPNTVGTQEAIDICNVFRGHATVLRVQTEKVIFKKCKPTKKDLYRATKSLMGLSNNIKSPKAEWSAEHIRSRMKEIEKYLNLPDNLLE